MIEMLTPIQDDELKEINGGFGVLETIGIVAGLYALLREIVRDAGEAAAYRDLGM